MDNLTTKYKEFFIDYHEGIEKFRAFVDGKVAFENISLRELKIGLDKFKKIQNKKDFVRFAILAKVYGNFSEPVLYYEGEVTSIDADKNYWILVNNNRSKEPKVILATSENKKNTSEINLKLKEVARLHKEIDNLESLIGYTTNK
jgi:hypothetical protein